MERMQSARDGLEQIQKDLARLAESEGQKEFMLASVRVGEALQHFDHAIMLVADVVTEGKGMGFMDLRMGGQGVGGNVKQVRDKGKMGQE